MPLTCVHNKEHCVQLQLFNRCPVRDRWCFIFTHLSRQHNALSCQGLMELPLTLDANSGTSLLEHYRCYSYCLEPVLKAVSPHWRRSRKFRNQGEEHNTKIYAECNLVVHGKESFKKQEEDDLKKKHRNSRRKIDDWILKQTKISTRMVSIIGKSSCNTGQNVSTVEVQYSTVGSFLTV